MSALSRAAWLLCGAALLAGRLGWPSGVYLAVTISALHGAVLASVFGRPASVAIQLRSLFAAVAVLGAALQLPALHWLQILGVTLRVGLGYCIGGRLLLLLPWNRTGPLGLARVWTLFRPGPLPHVAPGGFDGPGTGGQRTASARSASPS